MPDAAQPEQPSNDGTSQHNQSRWTRFTAWITSTAGMLTAVITLIAACVSGYVALPFFKDDLPTPDLGEVRATCEVHPAPAPDTEPTLTYRITSDVDGWVRLGAEILDQDGVQYADGTGDTYQYEVHAKVTQTSDRPLIIPADLPKGTYEIVAEIWPPLEDVEGKDTIAEARCGGFFRVR